MRDLFFTQSAIDLQEALGACIVTELQALGSIPAPQIDLRQFLYNLAARCTRPGNVRTRARHVLEHPLAKLAKESLSRWCSSE
jgi:hypothetical protein